MTSLIDGFSHYKETKEIWDQQAEQIIESVFAMIKSSGTKTSDLVIQLLRVIFELPLNFAALCQKIVIGLAELLRVIPKVSYNNKNTKIQYFLIARTQALRSSGRS